MVELASSRHQRLHGRKGPSYTPSAASSQIQLRRWESGLTRDAFATHCSELCLEPDLIVSFLRMQGGFGCAGTTLSERAGPGGIVGEYEYSAAAPLPADDSDEQDAADAALTPFRSAVRPQRAVSGEMSDPSGSLARRSR